MPFDRRRLASWPKIRETSKTPSGPRALISPRAVTRLKSGHVWIYRSDILSTESAAPGSVVSVTDERGRFFGSAFYSSSSQIALRMISPEPVADFPKLLRERVRAAIAYREPLVRDTDAYRIVFSEADFLAGLIVDRYNDILSLQILTQAMDAEPVRAALLTMNGVRFHFDIREGQKTGAFLDQRENYAAAAQYAYGEALDIFCYQGAFALHLARRCSQVTGVDSSRPALEVADKNALLNGREIEWIEANAFDLLRDYAASGRQYDTIVLDPPAFAKTRKNLETALRGYKEINLRALKMLGPGGILVTCSCSYHVSETEFLEVVGEAARDAHRSLRVIEKRGQAKDHPILLSVPETSYLKCLILHVN